MEVVRSEIPAPDASRPVTLAVDESARGSVALRRRLTDEGAEVFELITNGTFVMDTLETTTERLLARAALAHPPATGTWSVTVGGLGLGFTVRELLADPRITHVDVVELEPAVVAWVREGLVPDTAGVLDDPRVRAHVDDVRRWLPERPDASTDAILLDVDNGPDFLVHMANTEVYEPPFLAVVKRALRPGGVVAVWSATRSTSLRRRLERTFAGCEEVHRVVEREGRDLDYYLYVARRS
ncbi:spermidine synthase [Actinopolymorpha pittospori]